MGTDRVGSVAELWRYPVKSMGGEQLERCTIGPGHGIPGDRGWAVRDEVSGEIRGAKRIPQLLHLSARYLSEPRGDAAPAIEIALPDGATLTSDAPEVHETLSRALGLPVTLWPKQPRDNLDHYRRKQPMGGEADLRALLGLLPDEPLPDMSGVSPDLAEFTSPPGTYFDAVEIHLLTRASLATVAEHTAGERVDVRRFRPNLLVDTRASGLPEFDWCGRALRIGKAGFRVARPVMRCVMTTCAQGDLPKAPGIMRTLVQRTQQNLGVGLEVVEAGEVCVGDPIELH